MLAQVAFGFGTHSKGKLVQRRKSEVVFLKSVKKFLVMKNIWIKRVASEFLKKKLEKYVFKIWITIYLNMVFCPCRLSIRDVQRRLEEQECGAGDFLWLLGQSSVTLLPSMLILIYHNFPILVAVSVFLQIHLFDLLLLSNCAQFQYSLGFSIVQPRI